MAVSTLLALDASLPGGLIPGGGDLRYAQTMAFTTPKKQTTGAATPGRPPFSNEETEASRVCDEATAADPRSLRSQG